MDMLKVLPLVCNCNKEEEEEIKFPQLSRMAAAAAAAAVRRNSPSKVHRSGLNYIFS